MKVNRQKLMYRKSLKGFFIGILLTTQLFCTTNTDGAIIMGGAYVRLNGGTAVNPAYLVVNDPATTAISGATGGIISENEYNKVQWNIATTVGAYVIPFAYTDLAAIHFTFNVTQAGVGAAGNFTASTYYTAVTGVPNNRPLPTGVTNFDNYTRTGTASENDIYATDRFWNIAMNNYTTVNDNPVASLTFTYRDAEWDNTLGSTNMITETNLKAQSWDGAAWTFPVGVDNSVSNTVTLTGDSLSAPWTLVSSLSPLPIQLLNFTAAWTDANKVALKWATASEINNCYYIVERSTDAINFTPILKVNSQGNSSQKQEYITFDVEAYQNETSYYRIKQVDCDGRYTYSHIAVLNIKNYINLITIYPNPARINFEYVIESVGDADVTVRVVDAGGKIVYTKNELLNKGVTTKRMDTSTLAAGNYVLQVTVNKGDLTNQKTEKQFLIR